MIPINLIFLQQILFDDIVLTAMLVYSLGVIVYSFSDILLNLTSASINKNAVKSHKFLFELQTKFLLLINVRKKLRFKKIFKQDFK
jgi:hypothetical protein